MIVEILSIGTELLMGQVTNTDASFLAARLSMLGHTHYHQTVVGDNPQRLTQALELALSRGDAVITSGGLGPTQDDMSKQIVAQLAGKPLVEDRGSREKLEAFFTGSGREMTPNNLRQAWFPEGCLILENDCGTAPGCIVECRAGKYIIMLPGPPRELVDMFDKRVAPWLQARSDARLVSRMLHVFGMGESSVEHVLRDMIAAQTNPTIAPYASFGEMAVRVTYKADPWEDPAQKLDPVVKEIKARLGDVVYGEGKVTLQQAAVNVLAKAGKTLAVAESCTGGLICAELVQVPGVSQILLEGCVTYSNQAKVRTLKVSERTLERFGAVSPHTAAQMAEGVRLRAGADYGISTTGIAGPDGGTEEKPVGLVYIALAAPEETWVQELRLTGDRQRIRTLAMLNGVDMLRRQGLGLPMPGKCWDSTKYSL